MQTDALLPDLQRALAGRYVLERRLGQGGMGVVYLAREVSLERRVALKLLAPEQRFRPTRVSASCGRRAPGPSRVERVARRVCHAALTVAVGIVAAVVRAPRSPATPWSRLPGARRLAWRSSPPWVARMRTEYRTDPKAERRLRFWHGPLGRWLFALGELRARPRRPGPAATLGVTPVPDEGG